jgi:hypothetical protein
MKGGNSSHNVYDLDKGNILKPTFNPLMEEGQKVSKHTTPILKSSSFHVVR